MSKDHFDASLGLAFSLKVFERYRKNGLLQAEIYHIPGIRGRCMGYIQLVEGKVTSCYVEVRSGERQPMELNTLITVDTEKGPFEWKLIPLPAPPSPTPPTSRLDSSPRLGHSTPVPRIVAPLDVTTLHGWTDQHKLMLRTVYRAIDGQRSIEEIKREMPLRPEVTEEALRVLLALNVITTT
ncbi:hypothetical protein KSC_014670 [Ktedonobacter sp. SOSP1-52]|uniref:hypothetical protein n=1 Tax=Ktedonobacter sp. SOSP1-52 TaxID=2778366 RepID=UPI001A2605DE|nr:hypothetical protein [Ktedonobacter sp. SOSP1-52]GHO62575.1 hypothetical protein KSC_014670 [Ktedonobacter sp. SOSP1-52]